MKRGRVDDPGAGCPEAMERLEPHTIRGHQFLEVDLHETGLWRRHAQQVRNLGFTETPRHTDQARTIRLDYADQTLHFARHSARGTP